jgi:hypothetical protein
VTLPAFGARGPIRRSLARVPRVLTVAAVAAVATLTATLLTAPAPADAAPRVLRVGPGERFATPCAAFAVARTGDRVTIDAAGSHDYRGDVCTITADRLRITGVNGRPRIRAAGQNAQGKAIWVVAGDGTRITNVEMSGARVPDRNGAAIRQEGADLLLRRVWFHHNEMGLLAGDNPDSDIRIVRSRFSDNGFGDGYSHNIYVNHVNSLRMSYSWSSRSHVGHLVKSRAASTFLMHNRFSSDGGASSYEVDLPNGGLGVLVGNAVRQGPETENLSLIAFGEEGDLIPGSSLHVVGNTLVDDSGRSGTAVLLGGGVTGRVELRNNVVVAFGTVSTGAPAESAGNCLTTRPRFRDRRRLDYFLRPGSRCHSVRTTDPGSAGGRSLAPRWHYTHPASRSPRTDRGEVVGAFGTPRAG